MKESIPIETAAQTYPLATAQRINYFTFTAFQRPEMANIATGIYFQYDKVNFDLLRECIRQGYRDFEAMRLRFTKDGEGNVLQYLVPADDREITLADFSDWREEDAHAEMTRWSRVPFQLEGGPMNEIVMVRLPDHYSGLYLKVSHLTMDAAAIVHFFSYVLGLYFSREFPQLQPPTPPKSYLEQLMLDLAYEDNSPALERDRKYWQEQLEQPEPIYTPFSARNRLFEIREQMGNPNLRSSYLLVDPEGALQVYDLEDEATRALLRFSQENHVPVVTILLLGLRTVFSHFSGNEKDVSVRNALERRGTLLEKQSGGTRIHFWPVRTVIEPETSFLDALKIVQAKENALLRHANYDCLRHVTFELHERYGTPMGTSYECTTLSYLPISIAPLKGSHFPDLDFKYEWYTNGVAPQVMYVTAIHRPNDNGLSFHFEYQKNAVSLDEVEKFYYYLCRAIFRGIEDPHKTIGEILDWM